MTHDSAIRVLNGTSSTGLARADVRTVVIDDHTAFAESLSCALDAEQGISVVGFASSPWGARELLDRQVDVAILDLQFGRHDALELAREIRQVAPRTALILMTEVADTAVIGMMISLGARGYVHKGQGLRQIADAVLRADSDQVALPAAVFTDFLTQTQCRTERTRAVDALRAQLTSRECEVLALTAHGLSTREIAAKLALSVNTIRSHIQNTLTKLGVNSRIQAVALAIEVGLVGSAPESDLGVARIERRSQSA